MPMQSPQPTPNSVKPFSPLAKLPRWGWWLLLGLALSAIFAAGSQAMIQTRRANIRTDFPARQDPLAGWQTYRNEEFGFEFRYPANIFVFDKTKLILIHKLQNFHKYSAKDGSDLGLAIDISLAFKPGPTTCDYLENILKIQSLGASFILDNIQGVSYGMGAEGEGVVDYCIKDEGNKNIFVVERKFLNESYGTVLSKQSDYIPSTEQSKLVNQILSTFKFIPSTSSGQVSTSTPMLGGDKDEHGCVGSAGYSWCQVKDKCLRIWEEKCELVNNSFSNTIACEGTIQKLANYLENGDTESALKIFENNTLNREALESLTKNQLKSFAEGLRKAKLIESRQKSFIYEVAGVVEGIPPRTMGFVKIENNECAVSYW